MARRFQAAVIAQLMTAMPFEPRQISAFELLADDAPILDFTLYGPAATKKNSSRIICRRGKHTLLPSEQYIRYETLCKEPCEAVWKNKNNAPIDFGVELTFRVYLTTWLVGDHVGYAQALCDILEHHGIFHNDSWVQVSPPTSEHWFGGVDASNPRVEIIITRKRHPKETFRAAQEAAAAKRAQKKKEQP